MPWISYAQNGEDVRLRRAFADRTTGFYVDVGANHPVVHSVTKHFYEKGWSGVNIEPLPKNYAAIAADRPRDATLNVGCSNQDGELTLYAECGVASGMSSYTPAEVAIHRSRGFEFEELRTPVVTLASVCATYVGDRTIDFMSVDVEGHEREALEGADFARYRPRVVLIEATRPNSTEPTHERWESIILNQGYSFAAFDGLNRYYVRNEDAPLADKLALAPNAFDDYIPFSYHQKIEQQQREILQLYQRLDRTRWLQRLADPIGTFASGTRRFRRWLADAKRSGSRE